MKKLLLLALLVVSAPATASDEKCKAIEYLATIVMTARQAGVPMSQSIDLIDKKDKEVAKITRAMVLQAYEQPRMQVESNKQMYITRFGNEWASACYRAE